MRVKITSAQIIALRSAEMQEDGSYILPTAKAQTLAALARIGVVTGPRSLTVQGVSVMHTVRDVEVIASKGHTVYLSDAPESLALFTLGERVSEDVADAENGTESVSGGTVEIQGEYVEHPDAFRHMAEQLAEARESGCAGLCAIGTGCEHCDTEYGPEESQESTETVCVVQARAGMNGMMHYHTPGCRDIKRECKRYGASEGMGMYSAAFSSVAAIIEHEYSDVNDGDASLMIEHANSDFDGLKIMSCLSIPMGDIQGAPVVFRGNAWSLGSIPLEDNACGLCGVFGDVSMPGKQVGGNWVCGFCLANGRKAEFLDSHALTRYVETERAGIMYECATCGAIDTAGRFAERVCGVESDIPAPCEQTYAKIIAMADESDGGFVETLVTKEYELSVMVDDSTGATVSLGWVALTLNAAHVDDYARVAEEYGRVHGSGTPRHGWASIITVHDVADI